MKKFIVLLVCLMIRSLVATPQVVEQGSGVVDMNQSGEILRKQLVGATPEQKKTFYDNYLTKYYPRALVIRGQFLAKTTPEGVDRILEDIVKIFKYDPALYFFDDVSRVKIGFHWEVIVDQLSLISEFLKKAYVDLETNELFLLEKLLFGVGSSHLNCTFLREAKGYKKPMKQLLAFMREKRLTAVVRFYATYFDYLNRLFMEGVLFEDLRQAQRYQHELEFVMTKLRGTDFERTYQEPLNVTKQLMTILQARKASAVDDDDREDFSDGHDPQAAYRKPSVGGSHG